MKNGRQSTSARRRRPSLISRGSECARKRFNGRVTYGGDCGGGGYDGGGGGRAGKTDRSAFPPALLAPCATGLRERICLAALIEPRRSGALLSNERL